MKRIDPYSVSAALQAAQPRLGTQYAIARLLVDGAPLRETISGIFKTIGEREGFAAAAMWQVAPGSGVMHCVDSWADNDPRLDVFVAGSRADTAALGRGMGLAGHAWETGAPLWAADLRTWKNVPLPAIDAGLRSGLAFPIGVDGEVKGVMVFFGFEVREAETVALEMFNAIGYQIGQFMEREAQRAQMTRLNRVYAVMSDINAAIVRVHDQQHLFDDACRIAVEKGKFGMAWVGIYDPATLDMTPVAWGGLEARDDLIVSKSTARADVPEGRGAVGQAIRAKKPAYCNDLTAQAAVGGERRREAVRRGYRSQIALPLLREGEVVGMLSLFAAEVDFFAADEVRLLTELAGNLSFALEHLAKKDRIDYLANRDLVTGVANRNLLYEHLRLAMAEAFRAGHLLAVAVLKIENFRAINETLGHSAGDMLLKVVARRVGALIGSADTLARLGGGDFALVLPLQSDAVEGAPVASRINTMAFKDVAMMATLQRVLDDASRSVTIGGRELQPKCSLGVSLYPQDGADTETLLKNAAAAATHARERDGHNFQFYTPELNDRLAERLTHQSALHHALENNEFSLYYQPKINLATGKSSGAEGLLRWNKPGSGLVQPDDFIPLLEESGQIIEVGRWVMAQAVKDCRQWQAGSPRVLRLAVNVSAVQLGKKNFPQSVEAVLQKYSAQGAVGLDLEITESLIMRDIEAIIVKLKAVRDMGVNIIIDDFGTGYSSLRYLAKLPGNTLKIDRAFVQEMQISPDTLTIVTTIISLAHSLGLSVVAEGVETETQKNTLRVLNCDEIQGYLVSHPLPKEQFEMWWNSQPDKTIERVA